VLFDLFGDYNVGFWIGALMSVLSAAGIWLAAPRKVRAVAGRVHLIATAGGTEVPARV
jgi:hypothetical protein